MADEKPFTDEELKQLEQCKTIVGVTCFYRRIIAADRKRIEELMGGTTSGHKLNCSHCGRAMVWSRTEGAWMCPNCVLHRCDTAEDKVRFLDKLFVRQADTIERLRGKLDNIAKWGNKLVDVRLFARQALGKERMKDERGN